VCKSDEERIAYHTRFEDEKRWLSMDNGKLQSKDLTLLMQ